MKANYQVVVVGCGFAGLAAAEMLTRHGMDVLLIDENYHTGGQLLRTTPRYWTDRPRIEVDGMKHLGFKLIDHIHRRGIHVMHGAQVLGIYPERRLIVIDSSRRILDIRADFIICATGARERFIPFKGWTLPGVIATGAAQILIKNSGILPADQTLIAGCGPLPMVLAAEIISNNGGVCAFLDQTSFTQKLGTLSLWRHHWPKLFEGAYYLSKLLLARTSLRHGMRIVEARGRRHLEEVVAARVDRKGRPITGTEKIYRPEALAVGYGFTPNIELAQQAGCSIEFSRGNGGWIVSVDNRMESSLGNIYAVGEITGIAGAKKSYIEGQIAAWSILDKLSLVDTSEFQSNLAVLGSQRQHQMEYGRFLNNLCQTSVAYYESIHDDTVICRCEEIKMGTIRRYISDGFTTMGALKKATRCGMGNCQGRICGPIMFDILSAYTCRSPGQIGYPSVRYPIKMVPMGAFLGNLS